MVVDTTIAQPTMNPTNNVITSRELKKATVYEKLTQLAEEIQEGIRSISDSPKDDLDTEIEDLRENSYHQRAPEAEFAIGLFRKYTNMADSLKGQAPKEGNNGFFHNTVLGEVPVPTFIYEGTAEQLAGYAALGNNLFWLRVLTCLFCFLSYVIMATVPGIGKAKLHPTDAFLADCSSDALSGVFDYRPYQLVIAVTALTYAYSLITTIFYVLPMDDDNRKFIPGLESLFTLCLGDERAKDIIHMAGSFLKTSVKAIEMVMDIMFVIFVFVVCIIASIVLERGARFDLGNGDITYYTVGTFFSTYAHTYPVCVNEDPSPKIRAALAMAYITLFILVLCSQVSFRSFRYELRLREKTTQQLSINVGKAKSRREIEHAVVHDEERGARSLVSTRDDDVEEVVL
eukprot:CAMPEP_0119035080 /NCGR_PEP_ID=MMETSP1177-20130426/2050_1 /TAXON_ID=2985 /ORGANISM="Ochromonas sp, Strain CCMP1899" /LENGTH=400 /DNA_ID=CAMNT_0006992977 /DNA_START=112 /DNA_END=1314 /DNA_ORIENTATION=+